MKAFLFDTFNAIGNQFGQDIAVDFDFLVYGTDGKHNFVGYHDINPLRCNRILSHQVTKNTYPSREKIEVGYFSAMDNKRFIGIGWTELWNFQQGARLQWIDDEHLIFNKKGKNIDVASIVDLNGVEQHQLPAFYSKCQHSKLFVTLSFSTLFRHRPGYGYQYGRESNIGIIGFDINGKRVFEIKSSDVLNKPATKSYFNHLLLSPQSDYLFFMMIREKTGKRLTEGFIYHISSRVFERIPAEGTLSHHCWLNDHLLLYVDLINGRARWMEYNVVTKGLRAWTDIRHDGHPHSNGVHCVYDSYPNLLGRQKLYVFGGKERVDIGSFKSGLEFRGDLRCDLHPRISGNTVFVDTPVNGFRRIVGVQLPRRLC